MKILFLLTLLPFSLSGMALKERIEAYPRTAEYTLFRAGHNFLFGRQGVTIDYERAHNCLLRVASQTNDKIARALACVAIGEIFLFGWGRPQDLNEARRYFQEAAQQQHCIRAAARAYYYTGLMLLRYSENNVISERLAAEYFRRSYHQDYCLVSQVESAIALGRMHEIGKGVYLDLRFALLYYGHASYQTNFPNLQADALRATARIHMAGGQGMDPNPTFAQALLARAQEIDPQN